MGIELVRHADAAAWANAIAAELDERLTVQRRHEGRARLLLSGGSTPAPVYAALAVRRSDWTHVEIGLVDERWLDSDHPASNARMIRETLIDHAPGVEFAPLAIDGHPLQGCVEAANLHAAGQVPACVAVLGMGNDGHTASLFPGAAGLDAAFADPRQYAALDATGCPVAGQWPLRITLTPAGLSRAESRMLLIRGQDKLDVLQRAQAGHDPHEYPIRLVLHVSGPPLRVHWCP
jgi:6-phosphogluconolactonase